MNGFNPQQQNRRGWKTPNANCASPAQPILIQSPWPACIGVQEAAKLFGWPLYYFPILARAGHLIPLGKPAQNSRKWYSTAQLEYLSRDPEWLDKAIRIIERYIQGLNQMQRGKLLNNGSTQETELDETVIRAGGSRGRLGTD